MAASYKYGEFNDSNCGKKEVGSFMFKKSWIISKNVFLRFQQEGFSIRAAGLAYVTLLGIVPLLTVSLSIFAAFPVFQTFAGKVQTLIVNNFVSSSANVAQEHLQDFVHQASQLSFAGIVSLLVTAVLMIFSMEQAFNQIWRISKQRNIVQAFLLYWAVLTLVPIIIASGFMLSSFLLSITGRVGHSFSSGLEIFFDLAAPYIFSALAFTFLYLGLPNRKIKISHAILGGIIAAILFEIVKSGFSYFIANFANYTLVYGALAAIPIFLLWLYLTWVVILLGALFAHELEVVGIFNK